MNFLCKIGLHLKTFKKYDSPVFKGENCCEMTFCILCDKYIEYKEYGERLK